MSRGTPDTARGFQTSVTGLSPSPAGFPKTVLLSFRLLPAVLTPECTHSGLGSFRSARRYSGNRFFFLFLRVLRCFSSPGSPCTAMDSPCSGRGLPCRVSPFRNRRVSGYMLLTAAYRSLSRLSSALSAKASTLRPLYLDPGSPAVHSVALQFPLSFLMTLSFFFSLLDLLGCLTNHFLINLSVFQQFSVCSFQGTSGNLLPSGCFTATAHAIHLAGPVAIKLLLYFLLLHYFL